MTASFQTTPVFQWNYESRARIKNNPGGTSSGKTYAILQVIYMRLIEKPRIATIIGQDVPNLKKGALRDFQERILPANPWMYSFIASYNSTKREYRFHNGSILEFVSFKDAQDAHSGKRDIAFFNEAPGISYEIYKQVTLRTTEEIFLDYNPSSEFWVHDHVIPDPNTVTFYSNFSHNPYCPPAIKEYLLSLRGKDQELWDVYGLGKTGSVSEIIYKNWDIVEAMPARLNKRGYGMDFGYGTAPTAMIDAGLQNDRDLYVDEIMYGWKFKLDKIDQTLKDSNLIKKQKIYADSASPFMVDELRDRGYPMVGADKGPGSVNYGIEILLDYKIHVTANSLNLINELKRYKRKVDNNGVTQNEPVKAFDHLLDALRYYAVMNLKKVKKSRQVAYSQ